MRSPRVRWATSDDSKALMAFFSKAYGPSSVFTSPTFLDWFLRSADGYNSVIAETHDGGVVAHYGAVRNTLMLKGTPASMWWGVNAFTLPEFRGRGLGARLLAPFLERAEVFGVIGFTLHTADFYERAGFNLFGRARFTREVRVLDAEVFELSHHYGKTPDLVRDHLSVRPVEFAPSPTGMAEVSGDASTLCADGITTTLRDEKYLRHRFRDAPAPSYQMLSCEGARAIVRTTQLKPTSVRALNIVDLIGTSTGVRSVLSKVLIEARNQECAFVDFMALGSRYSRLFADAGFDELEGEEVELLPLLSSPMARRENHEFVGLFSHARAKEVSALTRDDVFFTRADSDRDRAARLSDLATEKTR